jgi:hypothetical protein
MAQHSRSAASLSGGQRTLCGGVRRADIFKTAAGDGPQTATSVGAAAMAAAYSGENPEAGSATRIVAGAARIEAAQAVCAYQSLASLDHNRTGRGASDSRRSVSLCSSAVIAGGGVRQDDEDETLASSDDEALSPDVGSEAWHSSLRIGWSMSESEREDTARDGKIDGFVAPGSIAEDDQHAIM